MVKGKTTIPVSSTRNNDGNSNNKRSREDLCRSDEDDVPTMEDVLTRMENLFKETNSKIDSCKADLQAEISTLRTDVQELKEECRGKIDQLSASIDTVRADVSHNVEGLARSVKANDLLLSGVPYSLTENLVNISNAVAVALGYCEQNIPLVYTKRLARLPINNNSAPPILMQFAFKCARDEFYRRYLSSRNLSLTHIGFRVNQRIFINENLTELGRRIKNHAVKLKRSGKLYRVFTRDGCVFVKVAVDSEAVPVRSIEDLPK